MPTIPQPPTLPKRLETVTVDGRIETLIRTRLGNAAICTSGSGRNDAESAAIAIEIVRRYNSHAALVEACRAALTALELSDQDRFDGGTLCVLLRSALALAEGGAA